MLFISKLRLFAVVPLTYTKRSIYTHLRSTSTMSTALCTTTVGSIGLGPSDRNNSTSTSTTNSTNSSRSTSSLAINSDGTLKKYATPIPTTRAAIASSTGDMDALYAIQKESSSELLAIDEHQNTPLIWAANAGQTEAVKLILQEITQQEQNKSNQSSIVNIQGFIGNTALSRAARNGDLPTVQALLQHPQIDANIHNDKLQYPLHFAAFKKHLDVVQYMLDSNKCDLFVQDRKGRTPAEDTSVEEIRELILRYQQKAKSS